MHCGWWISSLAGGGLSAAARMLTAALTLPPARDAATQHDTSCSFFVNLQMAAIVVNVVLQAVRVEDSCIDCYKQSERKHHAMPAGAEHCPQNNVLTVAALWP
jgi:hypothetical protein